MNFWNKFIGPNPSSRVGIGTKPADKSWQEEIEEGSGNYHQEETGRTREEGKHKWENKLEEEDVKKDVLSFNSSRRELESKKVAVIDVGLDESPQCNDHYDGIEKSCQIKDPVLDGGFSVQGMSKDKYNEDEPVNTEKSRINPWIEIRKEEMQSKIEGRSK